MKLQMASWVSEKGVKAILTCFSDVRCNRISVTEALLYLVFFVCFISIHPMYVPICFLLNCSNFPSISQLWCPHYKLRVTYKKISEAIISPAEEAIGLSNSCPSVAVLSHLDSPSSPLVSSLQCLSSDPFLVRGSDSVSPVSADVNNAGFQLNTRKNSDISFSPLKEDVGMGISTLLDAGLPISASSSSTLSPSSHFPSFDSPHLPEGAPVPPVTDNDIIPLITAFVLETKTDICFL